MDMHVCVPQSPTSFSLLFLKVITIIIIIITSKQKVQQIYIPVYHLQMW